MNLALRSLRRSLHGPAVAIAVVGVTLVCAPKGQSQVSPTIAGGNGSFETNTRGTAAFGGAFGQIWYLNPVSGNASGSDIPGWTLYSPTGTLPPTANTAWLMGDNTYGAPSVGTYQINVESGPDWRLTAPLDGLVIGTSYTITFDARQRGGGGGGNFDVFVNTTVPTGGFNLIPSSTAWAAQSFTFVAEAESHTLTISNQDVTNVGFFVDNFAIAEAPPDPWTPGDGIWTAGDGDWNTAGNWQADTIGQGIDRSATFNGLTPVTATLNVNRPLGALIFSGANHTIAAGSGSLTLDVDSLLAAPTVTVADGLTATIPATLSGTEGLLKEGAGTLVLSGINAYTGGTWVDSGTLILQLAGRTGNHSIGSFDVTAGSTLNLDNTNTILGGANEFYPAGFILTGEGTLTKTNIGSIDFWTGSYFNGFYGTVDVQEGALRINNITTGGNMDSATLNIASGAVFDVRFNASLSVDKLTGSGTLDQSFNGGSGLAVTVGPNGGSSTFGGVIQNSSAQPLALVKAGTGTFTLAGLNAYTGNTTVGNGTFELADGGGLKFVVSDASSNTITGTGTATIKGDFLIDTTAVSGTTGAIWTLVDFSSLDPLSAIDPATFTVIGFDDNDDDGVWRMTDAKGDWSFDESTGELTLDIGSDYDDWVVATGVQGGEMDDDDSDGLTNFDEYAFGLNPISGSSVNPIVNQLDKTSGTVSYTRRLQSKTDLLYTVRSSSTLDTNGWTNLVKDTDYTESVSAAGDLETVTITLTPTPTADKLFIQIKAEAP